MPYSSKAQQRWAHTKKGIKALGGLAKVSEWDKASKGLKLPSRAKRVPSRAALVKEHKELVKVLRTGSKTQLQKEAKEQSRELAQLAKTKRVPIIVSNKMKGTYGMTEYKNKNGKDVATKVKINVKEHKKDGRVDKAELASTIKHELLHVKYPKMTEKEVYKRTAKTKIPQMEQSKLLAKLPSRPVDKKVESLKRKFKMNPEEKVVPGTFINKINAQKELSRKEKVSFMGLV